MSALPTNAPAVLPAVPAVAPVEPEHEPSYDGLVTEDHKPVERIFIEKLYRLLTHTPEQLGKAPLHRGSALGNLGTVDVVTKHPLLKEVHKHGLLRALNGWKKPSPFKTHFVLVGFSGVHYEVRARQHDGLTGLNTPVVRRDRTRDRAFVARTAALLVERDFGLLGTILPLSAGMSSTPWL